MDKLLREEKIIVECLSNYECLKWEQLISLLHNKKRDIAERIINGLKKKQIILQNDGDYLSLDPRSTSDYKKIQAFWVLLKFIKEINPQEHYPAAYPSQIYFLKEGVQYEVLVLNKGEEHLLSMAFNENREYSDEDRTIKIIVVPNIEEIDEFVERIPEDALDNGLVMFSTVEYIGNSDTPTVSMYKI